MMTCPVIIRLLDLFDFDYGRVGGLFQDVHIFFDPGGGGAGGIDDGGETVGAGKFVQKLFDFGQFGHGQIGPARLDQRGELALDPGRDAA